WIVLTGLLFYLAIETTASWRQKIYDEGIKNDHFNLLNQEELKSQLELQQVGPLPENDEQRLAAEEKMAFFYRQQRKFDQAWALYYEIWKQRTKQPETYNDKLIDLLLNMAGLCRDMDSYSKALN